MIKVVHLQTHLPSSGNAAKRLHNAFLDYGIDSSMLSLSTDIEQNERIKALGRKERIISWLRTRLQRTQDTIKQYGIFSFPIYGWDVSKNEQVQRADIIYLHWVVGGFLSFKSLIQIAKLKKPVIFFMHDMWTITGGCHYSFDCEKFKIGCSNCQIFSIDKQDDLSSKGFTKKNRIFSKYNNLYFIAPSKWLFDSAKHSLLTKNKPVFHIPNVIDTKLFKPFDKQIAKRILNIDVDSFVIAFGASSVTSPYKGWRYIQEALRIYKSKSNNRKITILIFGSDYDNGIATDIPFDIKFLGQFKDDYSAILIYNAANLFLAPSLADNLPTTVIESMCCGTPVVGFNIGGIPDIIKHKENGYLAKYKDAEDLANGIAFCCENNTKGFLLQDFDTSRIIKKHMELFDSFNLNER